MTDQKVLTQKRVYELLHYNKSTGEFFWKKDQRNKNSVAGYFFPDGYMRIEIDGVDYLSHELAWLYEYGYMPKGKITHLNGKGEQNHVNNLEEIL